MGLAMYTTSDNPFTICGLLVTVVHKFVAIISCKTMSTMENLAFAKYL